MYYPASRRERVEYEVVAGNSAAEEVDRGTAVPDVEELETLLQTLPRNQQGLQDLLVNKNLRSTMMFLNGL